MTTAAAGASGENGESQGTTFRVPCGICRDARGCHTTDYTPPELFAHVKAEHVEKWQTASRCPWRDETGVMCRSLVRGGKAHFDKHLRSHKNEKPHVCPYCSRAFTMPQNLHRHIRRLHKDTKPQEGSRSAAVKVPSLKHAENLVACGACPRGEGHGHRRRFMPAELSEHVNSVHLAEWVPSAPCPWRDENGTLCGKAFARKGDYRLHTLKHTDERPYPCAHCDRTFLPQKG